MPRQTRQSTKKAILRFPLEEELQYGIMLKPRKFVTSEDARTQDKAIPVLSGVVQSPGTYIFLPMSNALTEPNRPDYATEDLGLAQMAFNTGSAVGDAITGDTSWSRGSDAVGSAGSYLARSALAGFSSAIGGVAAQQAGNVPNPYTTMLFSKTTQRVHTLDWLLTPASERESEELHQIINFLRYYSLAADEGGFLEMPHEWEIAFFGTNKLFDFSVCVMTDMTINWQASGVPAFYSGTDAPQSVQITITFNEILPLTKNLINTAGESGSMYLRNLSPVDESNRPIVSVRNPGLDALETQHAQCLLAAAQKDDADQAAARTACNEAFNEAKAELITSGGG